MSQWEKVYGVHAVEALLRHHPKRVKQLWLAEGGMIRGSRCSPSWPPGSVFR